MKLALKIAIRSLFSRRSKYAHSAIGWIAMIGLILGVASQTVAVSILSGFEKSFTQSILGFNAHLVLLKEGEINNPNKISSSLQSSKEITALTPFLYREGLIAHHSKVKGVVLKGIDPLTFQQVYDVKTALFSQASEERIIFEQKTTNPPILLGADLAEELGVTDQDRMISILSPQGDLNKIAAADNFKKFEVIGTFSSGLYEYDSQFALLNLPQAQKFFKAEGQVSGFEMKIKDLKRARSLAAEMEQQFGFPFQGISWDELNSDIFQALRLEKKLFFILMGLMVVVAAANLIGLLVVLVSQSSKEISILKAIGMFQKTLTQIFTLQGLLLAVIGIVFGLVLGGAVCYLLSTYFLIHLAKEVYLVSSLPILFSGKNAVFILLFSLIVSYLTISLASRRLVRMKLEL